jgi:2'-5' RNA ligase
MRLFVVIALADTVTAELARLCQRLRKADDGLRWSAAGSWHITLQFLGNADDTQFECLKMRLAEVRAVRVPVRLGGPDVFERAGAFVVEVVLTEELVDLQRRVVDATRKCGFVPEGRPYHPHITLARAKGDTRKRLKELKTQKQTALVLPKSVAMQFLLYESHLGPGGSKYEVRAQFSLTG